jgi:putative membrane protein
MPNKKPPRRWLIPHGRYLLILAAVFAVWTIVLAIEPRNRHDWLLENVLVLVGVIFLASLYRKLVFSRVSYTLIFLFMCLHQLGAH